MPDLFEENRVTSAFISSTAVSMLNFAADEIEKRDAKIERLSESLRDLLESIEQGDPEEVAQKAVQAQRLLHEKETAIPPSTFAAISPMGSAAEKSEAETVARNIMTILSRKGDVFRQMGWGEYKYERLQDGDFSEKERPYFDNVIHFCRSAETAILFAPGWRRVGSSTNGANNNDYGMDNNHHRPR